MDERYPFDDESMEYPIIVMLWCVSKLKGILQEEGLGMGDAFELASFFKCHCLHCEGNPVEKETGLANLLSFWSEISISNWPDYYWLIFESPKFLLQAMEDGRQRVLRDRTLRRLGDIFLQGLN